MWAAMVGALGGRAVVGRGIMSGIGGIFRGRSERRAARREREARTADTNLQGEWALRQTDAQGVQSRESARYDTELDEWQRQQKRRERVRGGANFAQFAGPAPQGFTNLAPISGVSVDQPRPTALIDSLANMPRPFVPGRR